MDHRLEHLGRGDHRLAVAIRLANQPLLDHGHFLERQLHTEVAARHHHGVTRPEDALEIVERGGLFDFGDELHRVGNEPAQLGEVVRPAYERQRHVVDAQPRRVRHVLPVLLRERRRADLEPGEVHPLVRGERAAVHHSPLDPRRRDPRHLDRQ